MWFVQGLQSLWLLFNEFADKGIVLDGPIGELHYLGFRGWSQDVYSCLPRGLSQSQQRLDPFWLLAWQLPLLRATANNDKIKSVFCHEASD